VLAKVDRRVELPAKMSVDSPVQFRTLFAIIGVLVVVALIYGFSQTKLKTDNELLIPQDVATDTKPVKQHEVQEPTTPQSESQTLTVEQRLKKIHELISDFQQRNQFYPNGKFLEVDKEVAQHSWISELIQQESAGQFSLAVELPWDDQVNDSFVRRRLEFFQNKSVAKMIGSDRYPATHFAGVSGVGQDAVDLPKLHPRAGIFSPQRGTTLADIIDGTANTIMLVGVNSELGSWGRPGSATIRSFNQEPYINGPDGLGTGQPDSMQVLMADGSVKTLSRETSPVIMRRMAAMADGLSLDSEVPGDPLTMTLNSTQPSIEQLVPEKNDPPIEPLFTPDPPQFDIKNSLKQKVKTYRTDQPQPLRLLLREFQELLGAPIDWSSLGEEQLALEIELSIKDATLAGVLDELAEKAKLSYSIEQNAILLKNGHSQE
jgi:hypothetical protein